TILQKRVIWKLHVRKYRLAPPGRDFARVMRTFSSVIFDNRKLDAIPGWLVRWPRRLEGKPRRANHPFRIPRSRLGHARRGPPAGRLALAGRARGDRHL